MALKKTIAFFVVNETRSVSCPGDSRPVAGKIMNRPPVTKTIIRGLIFGLPAVLITAALFIYLGLPDVCALQNRNPQTTALMLQRYREAQRAGKEIIIRQQWVAHKKIPKLLKNTIRVCEDAGFYQHQGVDFVELKAAIKKNWEKGKYVRGASTITQQLAKNLYLSTEKSLLRKIKEYFIARRLESCLGKKRIFNLYLNVIEFGPGIFGVQAAAKYYFHKDVSQLTLEEIVRLTAVIPRPLTRSPVADSRWLRWRADWILDTIHRYHYITGGQYQAVRQRFR